MAAADAPTPRVWWEYLLTLPQEAREAEISPTWDVASSSHIRLIAVQCADATIAAALAPSPSTTSPPAAAAAAAAGAAAGGGGGGAGGGGTFIASRELLAVPGKLSAKERGTLALCASAAIDATEDGADTVWTPEKVDSIACEAGGMPAPLRAFVVACALARRGTVHKLLPAQMAVRAALAAACTRDGVVRNGAGGTAATTTTIKYDDALAFSEEIASSSRGSVDASACRDALLFEKFVAVEPRKKVVDALNAALEASAKDRNAQTGSPQPRSARDDASWSALPTTRRKQGQVEEVPGASPTAPQPHVGDDSGCAMALMAVARNPSAAWTPQAISDAASQAQFAHVAAVLAACGAQKHEADVVGSKRRRDADAVLEATKALFPGALDAPATTTPIARAVRDAAASAAAATFLDDADADSAETAAGVLRARGASAAAATASLLAAASAARCVGLAAGAADKSPPEDLAVDSAASTDAERIIRVLKVSGADSSHAALLRASERLALASDATSRIAHVERLFPQSDSGAEADAAAAAHTHALCDVIQRSASAVVLTDVALAAIGWLATAAPRHTAGADAGAASTSTSPAHACATAAAALFSGDASDRVVWLALGGWAACLACARLRQKRPRMPSHAARDARRVLVACIHRLDALMAPDDDVWQNGWRRAVLAIASFDDGSFHDTVAHALASGAGSLPPQMLNPLAVESLCRIGRHLPAIALSQFDETESKAGYPSWCSALISSDAVASGKSPFDRRSCSCMGLACVPDASRYLPMCHDARLVGLLLHDQWRQALQYPVEDDEEAVGANEWLATLERAAGRLPAGGCHDPSSFVDARCLAISDRLAMLLRCDFGKCQDDGVYV